MDCNLRAVMLRLVPAALVPLMLLAPAGRAAAAVIIHDDFEYPTQAAFEASWTVANAPGAMLDDSRSVSGAKSVRFTPGTSQISRNARSFAETGGATATNPLTWSFRFYDEEPTLDPTNLWSNLQDTSPPGGNGQLIAMGLNNGLPNTEGAGPRYMARILGRDGGYGPGAWFKLDDPAAPARSLGWHELKAVHDGSAVRFYVDGILSKTVGDVAARSYDNAFLSSGPSPAFAANFDDFHLDNNIIPEPAALALVGLTCLMLGRRSCHVSSARTRNRARLSRR